MPTIFHKEGLIDKFAQHTLPARYFGNVNASGGTTGATNITVRSLIEKDYNTVEPNDPAYDEKTDFELVDELNRLSGVKVPNAIEEIRNADILHNTVCDKEEMASKVKEFLNI